ncbi:hypothetical protein OESDEN_05848 [Oesophagostomum dentatum]|uniref:Uncharacterized protein n=1 Tax=Oesophagostomum dentatum TaxID=61180 RepID=A0A0B1TEI9_OESDE|nr:hypothetical protein OESDEN_05848 [Oesophagostomum dentatum]
MSVQNGSLSRLDLFLAEARAKDFPLHYTFMDCALRAYGAFVVWLHFVMYLIFRHIYSDSNSSVLFEDDELTMTEMTQLSPDVKTAALGPTMASLMLKTARVSIAEHIMECAPKAGRVVAAQVFEQQDPVAF